MRSKTEGAQPADRRTGVVAAGRAIEAESFRIIEAEAGAHNLPDPHWQVVRRIIHTTGDFEFLRTTRFTAGAVEAGVAALRAGAPIFADTRMIEAGLAPWRLSWFGTRLLSPASDPETQALAERLGLTRSAAAVRRFRGDLEGGLIAVGNAPTALLEVIRLITEEHLRPALVIGCPVGFVQAAESKAALAALTSQPSIAVLGRKGGSAVAVAVLHALLELAKAAENQQG